MSRRQQWLLAAALAAVAWFAVALYATAQLGGLRALRGEPFAFFRVLGQQALAAFAWIPSTIAIVWLARRFTFRRTAWAVPLAVHVVASVINALLVNFLLAIQSQLVFARGLDLAVVWRDGIGGFLQYGNVTPLVYWVIAGVVHVVIYSREAQERELRTAKLEAQLATANLQALRAQLHPHFLFNALHTLGQLWRTGREAEAFDTLERLGGLLRLVLDAGDEVEHPLEEELKLIDGYLAIERTRFRDRLATEIDVEDETMHAQVPALLLQPLVENAIRHGIAPKAGRGTVGIRARRAGRELVVDVWDDGVGVDRAPMIAGNGIGLANTRERLEQWAGRRAALAVESRDDGGTVVTVRLPFRTGEHTVAEVAP